VGGEKVVGGAMDVKSTGSLPAPCFCLGDFLVERRGALPPLGPSVQDKLPEFPTLIGPVGL
jgi:hypothetical protein